MRISDWSSDVCASDLDDDARHRAAAADGKERPPGSRGAAGDVQGRAGPGIIRKEDEPMITTTTHSVECRTISAYLGVVTGEVRSEERRVGTACVSTCSTRWSTYPIKTKQQHID